MTTLRDEVADLCSRTRATTDDPAVQARLDAIVQRLDGPLRVAIAGKVKAGKSTLLNALVGERLAPTDAGECTRLVTRYREALGYEVHAVLRGGGTVALAFRRDDGELDIDLGGLDVAEVDHLDVGWPSSALRGVTLIDTPGLGSLRGEVSQRTVDFLAPAADGGPGEADAVLYLMRHLHRNDASFLETFSDRSLPEASPVNAIAVLSRADEIGAGRADAVASAERISARYRMDPRVRALASTVLPVAGLVAETGLTLRQDEHRLLVRLAEADPVTTDAAMVSVDRFLAAATDADDRADRSGLLARFGVYGIRVTVAALRASEVASAPELSRWLVSRSGLPALQELLSGHFLARADALKARTALVALRACAVGLGGAGGDLAAHVERIEAGAHELGELRLVHLVLAGAADLEDAEREEIRRLTWSGTPADRVGLPATSTATDVLVACLAGADRWRTRQAHPMTDPVTGEACDLAARAYERLYADSAAGEI